jgi:dolichol-phosphate mannosyltransferase
MGHNFNAFPVAFAGLPPGPVLGEKPKRGPDRPLQEVNMFSLVLPTFNERPNIEPLIRRVEAVLDQEPIDFEIILVDDNSPDETWKLAREIAEADPRLRVIRREGLRGLATAVVEGWKAARGEILGVMDADLQHPPEILPQLIEPLLREGADIAVASRHASGGGVGEWGVTRRFVSRGAAAIAFLLLPQTLRLIQDPMSGFFLFNRSVIASAPLKPKGYKILLEVLAKGNYRRVVEVPYVFEERKKGKSKLGPKQYLEFLAHVGMLAVKSRFHSHS